MVSAVRCERTGRLGFLAYLAVLGQLTACDPPPAGGVREEVHPLPELLLSSRADVPVIHLEAAGRDGLPSELAALGSFDEAGAVGRLDAAGDGDPLVFGSLLDADVDDAGRVLLLDGDYGVVRMLTPELEPFQVVGGAGQGPGEFEGPRSLHRLAGERFGVFDAGAQRIERFAHDGTTFHWSGEESIEGLARAARICVSGGTVYATGVRWSIDGDGSLDRRQLDLERASVDPEGFVHVLAEDGVARSFSMPYRDFPNPLLAMQYVDDGGIACADDRVWVAYGVLGEVHALDGEGDLRWIAHIDDLDFPGYLYGWLPNGEPLPRSSALAVDTGSGFTVERIDRVELVAPDILAVGVRTRQVASQEEGFAQTWSHRTYLLNPETGEPRGVLRAGHEVLGGSDGRIVLYSTDPHPRVGVVRLPAAPLY